MPGTTVELSAACMFDEQADNSGALSAGQQKWCEINILIQFITYGICGKHVKHHNVPKIEALRFCGPSTEEAEP